MSMVSPRLTVLVGVLAACLGSSSLASCKRHPPAPAPSASASALPSALAPGEEGSVPEGVAAPAQCRRLAGFGLTLDAVVTPGSVKPGTDPADDEDDDALLPFGVDIGAAVPLPSGFAVSGIRGAGQAFVALLGERASHRIDLGELHGDAETPAIAPLGEGLLVALRTTDAAGFTIKLGRIARADGSAVEWGFELSKLGKTVTGIELAVAGAGADARGVLVFQGEEKQGGSRLMLGTFAPAALQQPFELKALEAKDVEMPRLTTRTGGYWLSWVRTLPEAKKTPKKSAEVEPPRDPEERELLDVGLRVVEVAKLDERGVQVGAALRIGEPRRQVLLYDVASLASGGVLVAARSDSAVPGAEGGALVLSEVGADGSVREERLDDDEIGAGAPALLVDGDSKLPGPWLAMSAPSDVTRLGLVRGGHTALLSDTLLGRAEVVAVNAGHFLVQRARGRSVTLEALDCSWPRDGAVEKK
jgi:hypothetical protein